MFLVKNGYSVLDYFIFVVLVKVTCIGLNVSLKKSSCPPRTAEHDLTGNKVFSDVIN